MEGDLASFTTSALHSALEPISIPSDSPQAAFANWAKTFECRPKRVFAPTNEWQCRQIVELARREGATIHPVGVGHSPSDLACTNGWLVRMGGLDGTVKVGCAAAAAATAQSLIVYFRSTMRSDPPLSSRAPPFTPSTRPSPLPTHLWHFPTSDPSRTRPSAGSSPPPRTGPA